MVVRWIKVWWHCLINTFNLKEDHRMCVYSYWETGKPSIRVDFCSCGYLMDDVAKEGKEKINEAFNRTGAPKDC